MIDFLVRHALTLLFVGVSPVIGLGITLFLVLYDISPGLNKRLTSAEGSTRVIAAQALTVLVIYPPTYLLGYFSSFSGSDFLMGWIISVAANTVAGYLGNKLVLAFLKRRPGS